MIKYLSQWKDNPYARLAGNPINRRCIIIFSKGKFIRQDDGFLFLFWAKEIIGALKTYKPETGIPEGLTAFHLHEKPWELRSKDASGNWNSETIQPTRFEKAFLTTLKEHANIFLPQNKYLEGEFTFNDQLDEQEIERWFTKWSDSNVPSIHKCWNIGHISDDGSLPDYPATAASSSGKYQGKASVSLLDKRAQLIEAIKKDFLLSDEQSLVSLASIIADTYENSPKHLEVYLKLLECL